MADVKAPAPGGRRQKRARQTRRSILAAAHELFLRQGYARTTIREIADRADVAWIGDALYTQLMDPRAGPVAQAAAGPGGE